MREFDVVVAVQTELTACGLGRPGHIYTALYSICCIEGRGHVATAFSIATETCRTCATVTRRARIRYVDSTLRLFNSLPATVLKPGFIESRLQLILCMQLRVVHVCPSRRPDTVKTPTCCVTADRQSRLAQHVHHSMKRTAQHWCGPHDVQAYAGADHRQQRECLLALEHSALRAPCLCLIHCHNVPLLQWAFEVQIDLDFDGNHCCNGQH